MYYFASFTSNTGLIVTGRFRHAQPAALPFEFHRQHIFLGCIDLSDMKAVSQGLLKRPFDFTRLSLN
jgi:hypothetical protein